MPVTISGSTGIATPDGTASAPSHTGSSGSTNGLYFPSATTAAIATNGTSAIYIDASQNVGIGTTSPTTKLHVYGSALLSDGRNGGFNLGTINYRVIGGLDYSGLYYDVDTGTAHQFRVGNSEKMRIDSSGNLLVGTTTTSYGSISGRFISCSPTSGGAGLFYTNFSGDLSTSALNVGKFDNNATTSQIFIKFGINNAGLGSGQINANGSSQAAFGSFSDARLKQNIVDLPSQIDKILALRPREFDYVESEGGGHQIGFVAQEIKTVYPDAVGERDDGMLTVTGWNKTEARLVKAIQELSTKLDALEAKVNGTNP